MTANSGGAIEIIRRAVVMTDLQLEVSQHTSFCQLLLFFLSSIACKKTSEEEKAEITVNTPQSVAGCELSSATVPADDFAVVLGAASGKLAAVFFLLRFWKKRFGRENLVGD
jgi:hypothetical protein